MQNVILSRKLALAGTIAVAAWVMGLYFAFQPMALQGFPAFITAGSLEWTSAILALGAGAWCLRLLFQAIRRRGVAWWAYAIGLFAAGGTVLVAMVATNELLQITR